MQRYLVQISEPEAEEYGWFNAKLYYSFFSFQKQELMGLIFVIKQNHSDIKISIIWYMYICTPLP